MDEQGSRKGNDAAREFLGVISQDEDLKRRIEQVVDDQILSATRLMAAERGFEFSRRELEEAVVERLSLAELIEDAAGPGNCNSSSGCRTPCVYCNSRRMPFETDLGFEVFERRQR